MIVLAKYKEQKTKSKKQRAKNKEQRTKNKKSNPKVAFFILLINSELHFLLHVSQTKQASSCSFQKTTF